jgi:hypothetical protein
VPLAALADHLATGYLERGIQAGQFSILTRKSVRRGSFDTVRALIRHIERYLAD